MLWWSAVLPFPLVRREVLSGSGLNRPGPFSLLSCLSRLSLATVAFALPVAFALHPVLDLLGRQAGQPLCLRFAKTLLPLYFFGRQRSALSSAEGDPPRQLSLGAAVFSL
jgi:hypothetical protein